MQHWKLFRELLNRNFIMLTMSAITLSVAVLIAAILKLKGAGHQDIDKLTYGIALACGMSYTMLFLVVGDKLRSLMSYNFNHLLPNFRKAQLKAIAYVYLILFILPMLAFLFSASISLSHFLTIGLLCVVLLLANLFNQLVSSILTLVFVFTGLYEFSKADKDPNYQAFDYLPFSYEISFTLMLVLAIFVFSLLILKLPKDLIGTTKGKTSAESIKVDPLITKSKLLLFMRQSLLSIIYDKLSPLKSFNNNSIVCFWNYKFTNLNYIRVIIVLLAFFPDIMITSFWEGYDNAHTEQSAGADIPHDLSILLQITSIFLLVVFGIFDGNKLGLTAQATRFLWLKQACDGIQPFINSLYYRMLKIACKEIILSYLGFILVISAIGFEHYDMVLLSISFMTIKIANILLSNMLTKLNYRRWIWLAIGLTNLILFIGLTYIKNQSFMDSTLLTIIAFSLTVLVCSAVFVKQYKKQVSISSLI